jgi:iron(III) transport system ATP-binding protein
LLEIENIEKSFGKSRLLTGLSLAVCSGKNVLLNGPSGCGKSTLLRLIAGLDVPARGTIRIEGRLATHHRQLLIPPSQRGIAMVFQDLGLWANLTARQNVLLGLAGSRLTRGEKQQRAQDALDLCQIASKAAERPFRLSVGEQQRVALARAIAVRPKLLLLDEPFTGLDLLLKQSLLEPILDLWRAQGTTVLLVSHYPADAMPLSADLVHLEHGRILNNS